MPFVSNSILIQHQFLLLSKKCSHNIVAVAVDQWAAGNFIYISKLRRRKSQEKIHVFYCLYPISPHFRHVSDYKLPCFIYLFFFYLEGSGVTFPHKLCIYIPLQRVYILRNILGWKRISFACQFKMERISILALRSDINWLAKSLMLTWQWVRVLKIGPNIPIKNSKSIPRERKYSNLLLSLQGHVELPWRYNPDCLYTNSYPANGNHRPWWGPLPQSFVGGCQLSLWSQHIVFDSSLLQHPRAKFSCWSTATGLISHVRWPVYYSHPVLFRHLCILSGHYKELHCRSVIPYSFSYRPICRNCDKRRAVSFSF